MRNMVPEALNAELPRPRGAGPAPAGQGSASLRDAPLASPRAAHRAGMRAAGPRRAVSDGPANAGRGASFRGFSDAGVSSRAGRDRPARVAGRATLEPGTGDPAEETSGDGGGPRGGAGHFGRAPP